MPHILSVSYDLVLLRIREMLLKSRGYNVTSAEGFVDAKEKCRFGQYDLLVMGHSITYEDKKAIMRNDATLLSSCCGIGKAERFQLGRNS